MASSFAAVVGSIGGAIALLVIAILFIWFFMSKFRKTPSNKDSETGSSDPSAVVEMKRVPTLSGSHGAREFRMEELEQATIQFSESNLIGCGTFGLVYKGLLCDGTIVAIKRRNGHPRYEFIREAEYLSAIRHRNLVTLIGFCQERGWQMLVYEYLPNGSIGNHLNETGKDSNANLEFKQRLAIATGAAKGLSHLHGLQPPAVHGNFKTANVLVDENFLAKVADAGLSRLLEKIEDASSSVSTSSLNAFRDPELEQLETFCEMNDVYSFGIFLLELIHGKEATDTGDFRSNDSMLQWVRDQLSSNDLVDHRLLGTFTAEGMRDLIRLMLRCTSFPGESRPRMEIVVMELEHILDKEIEGTTVVAESLATVTLGSQLFTN